MNDQWLEPETVHGIARMIADELGGVCGKQENDAFRIDLEDMLALRVHAVWRMKYRVHLMLGMLTRHAPTVHIPDAEFKSTTTPKRAATYIKSHLLKQARDYLKETLRLYYAHTAHEQRVDDTLGYWLAQYAADNVHRSRRYGNEVEAVWRSRDGQEYLRVSVSGGGNHRIEQAHLSTETIAIILRGMSRH